MTVLSLPPQRCTSAPAISRDAPRAAGGGRSAAQLLATAGHGDTAGLGQRAIFLTTPRHERSAPQHCAQAKLSRPGTGCQRNQRGQRRCGTAPRLATRPTAVASTAPEHHRCGTAPAAARRPPAASSIVPEKGANCFESALAASLGAVGDGVSPTGTSSPEENSPHGPADDGAAACTRQEGSKRPASTLSRTRDDHEHDEATLQENIRLRKREHRIAKELQETKDRLRRTSADLERARGTVDELTLKLSNLERIDRTKSAELLEERRHSDDLTKQVRAMSENLLNILNQKGDGMREATGLQKRCFKLVQEKTVLSVQSSLLRRQKGWAEAKARVLQDEVNKVYLGTHRQVKDNTELEAETDKEFRSGYLPYEGAKVYRPLLEHDDKNLQTIVDFLTHITHTRGYDLHGFLESSRVYSGNIRMDCLNALGREFYACWNQNRRLPRLLRAVERLCHLSDYLTAFESFSAEVMEVLNCGHARIWVVDNVRSCLWTSSRGSRTITLPLPSNRGGVETRPEDLEGRGLAVAACALQQVVNVADVTQDPRFQPEADAAPDGLARSVICVPIVRQRVGAADQVSVIIQASNKLEEPHFDTDTDVGTLRLLGKVSMEVMQSCLDNSAASTTSKRKDTLLHLFNEQVPCTTPLQLMQVMESGLRDIFQAQATALHVITHNEQGAPIRATKIQVNVTAGARSISKTNSSDGLRGVVGKVARSRNQQSFAGSTLADTPYDALIDLPVSARAALHSVPICEGVECVAVIQFVCQERETGSGEDGAYHPENQSHYKILRVLLNFIKNHLVFFQIHQESKEEAEVKRMPSKAMMVRRNSILAQQQQFMKIRAAVIIQSVLRGRMARARVRLMRSQSRRSSKLSSAVQRVISQNNSIQSMASESRIRRRRRSSVKSTDVAL
eukprot:TRINITY_DN26752_c0_g1_i1.p1 TRINITY_DN26752_c0_g1~~TRINITY_DN26752_c0_g1_i1.p1  ORF type:complete len:906 (+),score=93.67 TRINITY_DN26752_c0_g1_i1:143-2860(+)